MFTGLTENAINNSINALSRLLANSYVLCLKTQNAHWNITSHNFIELHKFFEEQYKELFGAVDSIAERIRALGYNAPASLQTFLSLTSLTDYAPTIDTNAMIKSLENDHSTMILEIRLMLQNLREMQDEATIDLMISRLHVHEKAAWMLKAMSCDKDKCCVCQA
jgi:starvation-inducible DNA-binding protein